MNLGEKIVFLRKSKNITQEVLAQQLGVTNQAVSKWESGQCCPDVTLLPKLADIFDVTLDALFGREAPAAAKAALPWADDDTVRAVIFVGRQLVESHPAAKEITFRYDGPALNVDSAFAVTCQNVLGNVTAGCGVACGDVAGHVNAGGNVNCGDVDGDLKAGGPANCGDVSGNVTAGKEVNCGDVKGSVIAGTGVHMG